MWGGSRGERDDSVDAACDGRREGVRFDRKCGRIRRLVTASRFNCIGSCSLAPSGWWSKSIIVANAQSFVACG